LARDMDTGQRKDERMFEPSNADPKSGHVLLSGNDFCTDTMSAFKDLLVDEHFTNVTLVTDGNKQIKAHKVILSAFSPFFKEILVNNPHQHPLVYLRGVKHDHLQSMVDFLYLGQTKIKFEEVTEFIKVASDLQIKGLSSAQTNQNDENPKVEDRHSEEASELEIPREMEEDDSIVKEEEGNLAIKQEVPETVPDCLDQSNSNVSPSREVVDPSENLEVVMDNPGPSSFYQAFPSSTESAHDFPSITESAHDFPSITESAHAFPSIIESPSPKFPCEFPGCRYIAAQKRYLREHRQAIHEGIKYSCDMCEHRATTKSNLKKHKQLKHELDRFFPCHQCDFTATTVGELTQHLGFCQPQSMLTYGSV